ncbi:oxidoreductase, 2OG-Fe(II) oxygenase family protein [Myxococcus stipitatus DSM 14675]|uniref:Oxidoreductase, 2OG-Fe(II) oxygenase family protein n=1 Tax=Myxococcus stipitatus (strain DSM 14675 / JCM 12634 / Mx s8) TaxID=1278073 RepID=L7UA45_MYXSD|nr:alpha-ketoglutarate-dependent dioxygenase AlkB [Myxococcus stipitatus]AGC43334.1 oxidoreductase, 2OG-Fe(II) oxygenase family protein [Myxococcus stipitatus DSM 14675]
MSELRSIPLGDACEVVVGQLPRELVPDAEGFQALWELHPSEFHEIMIHGRQVPTPRWQQAYGADYHYTGRVNRALPLVAPMEAWLAWARETFDVRLNGLLLNWYDGTVGHYIGKHRDSDVHRVEGSPIVTLSFGEDRAFRMRPWRGEGFTDIPAVNGGVIVISWTTNRAFTHEVPASARARGRRISVTLRAFDT